jgi:carbonic anhydrase
VIQALTTQGAQVNQAVQEAQALAPQPEAGGTGEPAAA